jgi:hypothetical protein
MMIVEMEMEMEMGGAEIIKRAQLCDVIRERNAVSTGRARYG